MVIAGLIIERSALAPLTIDFLQLKSRFYSGKLNLAGPYLERVLVEIKGADIRRDIRSERRRERSHALSFLYAVMGLLETHKVKLSARVWVKGIGEPFDYVPVYTHSIQAIYSDFEHYLNARNGMGFVIADSRSKPQNANVSHSIFTQKYKTSGDSYSHIVEMPTFGHSDNHVGLQLSDLVSSAFLYPMATYAYCSGAVTSVHVQEGHKVLRKHFGRRLKALQYRYEDLENRWRGGIVVNDRIGKRSAILMLNEPNVVSDGTTSVAHGPATAPPPTT
jgi:hypothetical protein